jgi:hypothetical protein
VLRMNVQNYKVYFGLYPSSGIYDKKSQRFGDWICLRPQVDGARQTYSVGPVYHIFDTCMLGTNVFIGIFFLSPKY